MSGLIILAPAPIAAVSVTRGSGAANLLTADPREVWADAATGSAAEFTVSLGAPRVVDTVFLGYLSDPADAATWTITGELGGGSSFPIQGLSTLRVPESIGQRSLVTHALWHGSSAVADKLRISVTQPAGAPITAGVLLVGQAFSPALGQEWGSGRRPIDTSSVTPLPSGGFSIVEGARKRYYGFTLGDLSVEETDRLEAIADDRGESRALLIVEDVARTAGLCRRIHYGLFERWRAYERRNRQQTRWEIGIEEWV